MHDDTQTIPYATPMRKPVSRGWAAATIIFGGLALVFLGGCFMIGAAAILSPNDFSFSPPAKAPPATAGQIVFLITMYILAFACFAGALVMIFSATRALLRLMYV